LNCNILFVIECYEKEIEQTQSLTKDIIKSKDYICSLTTSLNDSEQKCSELLNNYEQYKSCQEKTISVLSSKLNASEEIVKQLFPGN